MTYKDANINLQSIKSASILAESYIQDALKIISSSKIRIPNKESLITYLECACISIDKVKECCDCIIYDFEKEEDCKRW